LKDQTKAVKLANTGTHRSFNIMLEFTSSLLTEFGIIRPGLELPVGWLLGIIVRVSETVPPGGSDGLKLSLFSRAAVGLFVVGRKKFQAG